MPRIAIGVKLLLSHVVLWLLFVIGHAMGAPGVLRPAATCSFPAKQIMLHKSTEHPFTPMQMIPSIFFNGWVDSPQCKDAIVVEPTKLKKQQRADLDQVLFKLQEIFKKQCDYTPSTRLIVAIENESGHNMAIHAAKGVSARENRRSEVTHTPESNRLAPQHVAYFASRQIKAISLPIVRTHYPLTQLLNIVVGSTRVVLQVYVHVSPDPRESWIGVRQRIDVQETLTVRSGAPSAYAATYPCKKTRSKWNQCDFTHKFKVGLTIDVAAAVYHQYSAAQYPEMHVAVRVTGKLKQILPSQLLSSHIRAMEIKSTTLAKAISGFWSDRTDQKRPRLFRVCSLHDQKARQLFASDIRSYLGIPYRISFVQEDGNTPSRRYQRWEYPEGYLIFDEDHTLQSCVILSVENDVAQSRDPDRLPYQQRRVAEVMSAREYHKSALETSPAFFWLLHIVDVSVPTLSRKVLPCLVAVSQGSAVLHSQHVGLAFNTKRRSLSHVMSDMRVLLRDAYARLRGAHSVVAVHNLMEGREYLKSMHMHQGRDYPDGIHVPVAMQNVISPGYLTVSALQRHKFSATSGSGVLGLYTWEVARSGVYIVLYVNTDPDPTVPDIALGITRHRLSLGGSFDFGDLIEGKMENGGFSAYVDNYGLFATAKLSEDRDDNGLDQSRIILLVSGKVLPEFRINDTTRRF